MLKNKRGITLVALVITIIVLLILAGITINLTIGEGGIIQTAQQAGKNYVESSGNEQVQLTHFYNETENIINGEIGTSQNPNNSNTSIIPSKTAVDLNGYTSGTYTSNDIVLTFSATDADYYQYSIDDGNTWTTASNPLTIDYNIESNLYARAVSNTGNIGEVSDVCTIKRHTHIASCYHTHTGSSSSGGGCYTSPVYKAHSHTSAEQIWCAGVVSSDGSGNWYCSNGHCVTWYVSVGAMTTQCNIVVGYTCGKTEGVRYESDGVEYYNLDCGKSETTLDCGKY
jgi:hypothetical protein